MRRLFCLFIILCLIVLGAQRAARSQTSGYVQLTGVGQCAFASAPTTTGAYSVTISINDPASGTWVATPYETLDGSSQFSPTDASPSTLTATGTMTIAPASIRSAFICLTSYSSGSPSASVTLTSSATQQQYPSRMSKVTIVAPTDSAGNVKVVCEESSCSGGGGGSSPAPTISPGLLTGVTIACPSAVAGPFNGVYTCIIDSSGKLHVVFDNASPIPGTTPIPFPTMPWSVTCASTPCGFPTPIGWTTGSPQPVACITGCSSGGGGNVTIVAPTNAAGQVIVTTPAPVTQVSASVGPIVCASPYCTVKSQITTGNFLILTSASGTSCTSIAVGAFGAIVLDNAGPATSVFPEFYDEAGTPGCSAADLIYGDGSTITFGPAQIITLWQGVKNGLAYKLSGSLSSNLVVGW